MLADPASTSTYPDSVGDDPWEESDNIPSQEWTKLESDFTNAGYREGITAGKESALQEGFNEGFATVGVPLGREVGILRGTANAAMGYLSSALVAAHAEAKPEVNNDRLRAQVEELKTIINDLAKLNFSDLVPPDLQAEAHTREHMEQKEAFEDTLISNMDGSNNFLPSSSNLNSSGPGRSKSIAATQELSRLRIRLAQLLQELDLTTPLL